MKYVAWHNGQLLPDVILENIISAASRGKITEAGKKLLLVPDRRYGKKDETGLQSMRHVKRHECQLLGNWPRIGQIGPFVAFTFNNLQEQKHPIPSLLCIGNFPAVSRWFKGLAAHDKITDTYQ